MVSRWIGRRLCAMAMALLLTSAAALTSPARAEDFFSALFGAFGARPPAPPQIRMPFPGDDMPRYDAPRPRAYGGGMAYCVRGCDGRYFPAQGSDNESKLQSCRSLCPAGGTTLVYGADIDDAVTANGKPYSELPNAFRYRNELVQGCTCNGKDPAGLARVRIEDDPTLRKGDIFAGTGGLVVANRSAGDGRGAVVNFSPLPENLRAKFRHVPVVARE
jgi:hypothetical protein